MPWLWLGIAIGLFLAACVAWPLLVWRQRVLRRLADRARRAERLADLGMLTGGLAHEIKNPLSSVGLNLQLIQEDLRDLAGMMGGSVSASPAVPPAGVGGQGAGLRGQGSGVRGQESASPAVPPAGVGGQGAGLRSQESGVRSQDSTSPAVPPAGVGASMDIGPLPPSSSPAAERLGRIQRRTDALAREAQRLRAILEDFLRFAGRIRLDRSSTDLNALVAELADFYAPQAVAAGVRLRVMPHPQPAIVWADPSLLKQTLLNLMINATQAIADARSAEQESGGRNQESGVRGQESTPIALGSAGGTGTAGVAGQGAGARGQESGARGQESGVRGQESGLRGQESAVAGKPGRESFRGASGRGRESSTQSQAAPPAPPTGNELIIRIDRPRPTGAAEFVIHVIDTGPGIAPDVAARIFQPYFTTKKAGAGTGLGLPTSRRIIEEHGGSITLHSEPGRGSDFMIRLPAGPREPGVRDQESAT